MPKRTSSLIEIDQLPVFALESANGLVQMLNSISENAEGEASRRIHRAPINSAYLRHLDKLHSDSRVLPQRLKKEKTENILPYFKFSALENVYKYPIPLLLEERGAVVKRESLLHLTSKGYPTGDNALRKEWEIKFEKILLHFDSFDSLFRAINSVRKHTHVTTEDAFCALAYCDCVVLETFRCLTEDPKLRKEISTVRLIYDVKEIIQQVFSIYKGEQSSGAMSQKVDASSALPRKKGVHHVQLSLKQDNVANQASQQSSTVSENSLSTILSSPSRHKFERFYEEVGRSLSYSKSMDLCSRSDALMHNREEIRLRYQVKKV